MWKIRSVVQSVVKRSDTSCLALIKSDVSHFPSHSERSLESSGQCTSFHLFVCSTARCAEKHCGSRPHSSPVVRTEVYWRSVFKVELLFGLTMFAGVYISENVKKWKKKPKAVIHYWTAAARGLTLRPAGNWLQLIFRHKRFWFLSSFMSHWKTYKYCFSAISLSL